MDDRTTYWLEIAEYDLGTARAVLEKGRYLYVGFMCHQTIEKALKAAWQQTLGSVPPKTHSLLFLLNKCGMQSALPQNYAELIDELEPLNIQARYPEYREALARQLDATNCARILSQTTEMFEWIRTKLLPRQSNT